MEIGVREGTRERKQRGRRSAVGTAAFVTCVLAGVFPNAAGASTVDGDYRAAPGEANQLVIDRQDEVGTFTYTDTGVSSIDNGPFSPCTVSGNQATCPRPSASLIYEVSTGDMNDTISDPRPGYGFEVFAGAGNDEITAAGDMDLVDGGSGNDVLTGGPGSQGLIGGGRMEDPSTLSPASAPDDDRIEGRGGVDFLFGGPGTDHLDGGDATDEVEGGGGNDVLIGGPGNDELDLQSGDGGGSDVMDGGQGDDVIVGAYDDGAPDDISCGPGIDRVQIGANDRIDSACERVQELISCPPAAGAGPCDFTVEVSANAAASGKAAGASASRMGKRIRLGSRTAHLQPGRTKSLEIWLKARGVRSALKAHASVRGLIKTSLRHRKNRKPQSVARIRFALAR